MLARFLSWWRNVADSLWALPLAIAAGCAVLALFALNLELPWTSNIAWLYAGTAEQAPQFAASLVGAMITLTALAFSITMVVLTLAAQQLGPRLIGAFMSDRGTQMALGLFLGTVVYLLLLLRALDGSPGGGAPNLAITGGTALVLASVVTLLFFVHWLARSVVADHVIARIGEDLDKALERAFPERAKKCAETTPSGGCNLALDDRGYVQFVDYEGLAKDMADLGAIIVLHSYAGTHIIAGETDAHGDGASRDDLVRALKKAVVISAHRTSGQDPEWIIRQLVEIGLRALSPGINDEYTAMAVLDRLTLALSRLTQRYDPSGVWRDGAGVARVFGPTPTINHMFDAAFDQMREASADKLSVLEHMGRNLAKLHAHAALHNKLAAYRHLAKLDATMARAQ